jgi:hypothetical protein
MRTDFGLETASVEGCRASRNEDRTLDLNTYHLGPAQRIGQAMLNNGKKAALVGKASVILIHIHSTSGDKLLSACTENVLAILSNAEITWSWGFHQTMGMEGEK